MGIQVTGIVTYRVDDEFILDVLPAGDGGMMYCSLAK
jgi:hypothetical protein